MAGQTPRLLRQGTGPHQVQALVGWNDSVGELLIAACAACARDSIGVECGARGPCNVNNESRTVSCNCTNTPKYELVSASCEQGGRAHGACNAPWRGIFGRSLQLGLSRCGVATTTQMEHESGLSNPSTGE